MEGSSRRFVGGIKKYGSPSAEMVRCTKQIAWLGSTTVLAEDIIGASVSFQGCALLDGLPYRNGGTSRNLNALGRAIST